MDEEVMIEDEPRILRCSFCNKSQREVKKLIAGPTVFICDECVAICIDILREDGIVAAVGARTAERTADRAEEHLRIAEKLLESGELLAAARDARAAALQALRGLLAIDGMIAAEGWMDAKVFNMAMSTFPDLKRTLHEQDAAHVILRITLEGAELRREEVEQAMSAARGFTGMLRKRVASGE